MQRRIISVNQQEHEKTSWRQGQFNKELFMLVVDCLRFLLMVYAQSSCCSHVIKPCFVDSFSPNGFTPTWAHTLFKYSEERRWEHAFGVAWGSNPVCQLRNALCPLILGKIFPSGSRIPCLRVRRSFQKSRKHN